MHYQFEPKPKQFVDINFVCDWSIFRKCGATTATYCTITVQEPDGKIKHYHGASVFNPKDRFNCRTGLFLAFKKAMIERWDDIYWRKPIYDWENYYLAWSHFLSALMDHKVVGFDEYLNQF